jgi:hypothetical protein
MHIFVPGAGGSYRASEASVKSLLEMVADQFDILELQEMESQGSVKKDELLQRISARLESFVVAASADGAP